MTWSVRLSIEAYNRLTQMSLMYNLRLTCSFTPCSLKFNLDLGLIFITYNNTPYQVIRWVSPRNITYEIFVFPHAQEIYIEKFS